MENNNDIQIQFVPIELLEYNDGQIPGVPENPRTREDSKQRNLEKSIEELPEMTIARAALCFPYKGRYVVIGGNRRLEARALFVRLESRSKPSLVFRQKANNRVGVQQAKPERRASYNEACRVVCLSDTEQQSEGRYSIGFIWWKRYKHYSLRAGKPKMLHDGVGPALLRCYTCKVGAVYREEG